MHPLPLAVQYMPTATFSLYFELFRTILITDRTKLANFCDAMHKSWHLESSKHERVLPFEESKHFWSIDSSKYNIIRPPDNRLIFSFINKPLAPRLERCCAAFLSGWGGDLGNLGDPACVLKVVHLRGRATKTWPHNPPPHNWHIKTCRKKQCFPLPTQTSTHPHTHTHTSIAASSDKVFISIWFSSVPSEVWEF